MKSLSKPILSTPRLAERAYKIGVPGGGLPEDETDPEVRLRRQAEKHEKELAVLRRQMAAERDQAFKEGMRQAKSNALHEARERYEAEMRRLAEMMQQVATARKELYKFSEAQLVELILRAVEKILHCRPEYPEKIAPAVQEAFDQLLTRDNLTITCAPADAAFLRELLARSSEEFSEITRFAIREDPTISPGGCIVETEWGTIDARIEKQLAVLKDVWRQHVPAQIPAESTSTGDSHEHASDSDV